MRFVEEKDGVGALLGEILDVRRDGPEDSGGGGGRGEAERQAELAVEVAAPHLHGTKTDGSDRSVPLPAALARFLTDLRKRSGLVAGDWPNVRRDLAAACVRAVCPAWQGEHVSMKSCTTCNKTGQGILTILRRTFSSWMKNQGVDSAVVAALLGHKSTRMVDLVYGRLDPSTL